MLLPVAALAPFLGSLCLAPWSFGVWGVGAEPRFLSAIFRKAFAFLSVTKHQMRSIRDLGLQRLYEHNEEHLGLMIGALPSPFAASPTSGPGRLSCFPRPCCLSIGHGSPQPALIWNNESKSRLWSRKPRERRRARGGGGGRDCQQKQAERLWSGCWWTCASFVASSLAPFQLLKCLHLMQRSTPRVIGVTQSKTPQNPAEIHISSSLWTRAFGVWLTLTLDRRCRCLTPNTRRAVMGATLMRCCYTLSWRNVFLLKV